MQYVLLHHMTWRTRRRLAQNRYRSGHKVRYKPRADLIKNLMRKTGWDYERVYRQLWEERQALRREVGIIDED